MNRPDTGSEDAEQEHGFEWVELIRIAFVAFAAVAVWFRVWEPFPHISVIGIAATLIGRVPHFQGSVRKHRRAKDDDGTLDDHCSPFSPGNR
jgi:hypothetical protein